MKLNNKEIERLRKIAKKLRMNVIKMVTNAGSGHIGGSLSAAEIITALFFKKMRLDPRNPDWEDRDRFILSKGHACPIVYAALAELGYFPEEELFSLRKLGSRLQGHPDRQLTPGIEMSTGSLGQGLSVANGLALGLRLNKRNVKVYVLIGDGESQEGQIWEAAMTAGHYRLDNLCAILDYNQMQIDGFIHEIKKLEPLNEKWRAFGWETIEIDGHSFSQIINAFEKADSIKGRPTIIIARTVKGKGVSFMEFNNYFHGKAPTKEECLRALKELEKDD
ncbi:transketolase [Candidatus Aminicenantes bacterium AC-335-A11]|jgi:transketolase|nr:transketolase [SCandidatus Aminicenantes bacterium Aminicenantia_JdfR_composite]MCP2597382.1 transketolase [Candidatus Aminicenantes bacterium AC-335-G13]MCP2618928.1 transketolase [Candidatus Aminicenantes bacterium AC-335-A11]